MKFYSHKDKLLIKHLEEVKEYALEKIKEDNKELVKAVEIAAIFHDFGKYTSFFQKYLFSEEKEQSLEKNHGFISAIVGAFIGIKILGDEAMYPLLIYSSILHHHGDLKTIEVNLPKSIKEIDSRCGIAFLEKYKACFVQFQDMNNNKQSVLEDYKTNGFQEYIREFLEHEENITETLLKLKLMWARYQRGNSSDKLYFYHNYIYSLIISGDKLSAANLLECEEKHLSYEILNKERKKNIKAFPKTVISNIREEIFNIIQRKVEENYRESIFSITAPTGTGKTYSGFFAAIKLNEMLQEQRKIIYVLPFTSIIEQNFSTICRLYSAGVDGKNNLSTYILKHHSLSNPKYIGEKEYDSDKSEMLIENWNSGVIITTFVQLLETLIGNRNRRLKKFNSLKNSIILIDEIQAIDIHYYDLLDYILKFSVNYLGAKVIMMTATKPLVLKESIELLEGNEEYFKAFNRTSLDIDENKRSIDEFIDEFIENKKDKSYLIICNTINESLQIYNKLKKEYKINGQEDKIYYLSTNILPVHRAEIINTVSEKLENKEKVTLVSTQVVEAGVDFDFDVVIRDFAPLSSIIQSAGRCNRSGNKPIGEVFVVNIVDDNNMEYCNYVYGKALINITRNLFIDKKQWQEKEYFNLIDKYFNQVDLKINKDISGEFIKSIGALNFGGTANDEYSLSKFSLIKENLNYIDVYLRINEEAEELYEKIIRIFNIKDKENRRKELLEVRGDMRKYILSIPEKYKSRFEISKETILINLPKEGCEVYYDKATGFVRDESTSEFYF